MELFLFCWAVAWLIQRGVVDTTYAVRGQVSPRMQLKLAAARATNPTARYRAGDYARDLWSDTLAEKTERRRARKATQGDTAEVQPAVEQPAEPRRSRVRGTATTEPWAAPVMAAPAATGPVDPAAPGTDRVAPPEPCQWGKPGGLKDKTGTPCTNSRVQGHIYCWPHIRQAIITPPDTDRTSTPPVATTGTATTTDSATPRREPTPLPAPTAANGWPEPASDATTGGADKPHTTPDTTRKEPTTPTSDSAHTPDYQSTYTDEERRYWSFFPPEHQPDHFRREEETRAAAAKSAEPVPPASPTATSTPAAFPGPLATVTPITRNTHRGETTMTTTEHAPTGETVSLTSAISYADGMAKAAEAGVASVEQSMAHLTTGEVTGEALTHLATAQEALSTAQSAFTAAHQELTAHMAVQDAYNATPDAGSKTFVTGD